MAELNAPISPDVIRELIRRQKALERQVALLTSRRARTMMFDRGHTMTYPTPVEGMTMVHTENDSIMYRSNGKWRNPSGIFEIKALADDMPTTTGDKKFAWALAPDLHNMQLIRAEAYVTTVGSSVTTIQLRNLVNGDVDMLTTRITIDAGDYTSYAATTPSVVNSANARVTLGDVLCCDVDTAGAGSMGLGFQFWFGDNDIE